MYIYIYIYIYVYMHIICVYIYIYIYRSEGGLAPPSAPRPPFFPLRYAFSGSTCEP